MSTFFLPYTLQHEPAALTAAPETPMAIRPLTHMLCSPNPHVRLDRDPDTGSIDVYHGPCSRVGIPADLCDEICVAQVSMSYLLPYVSRLVGMNILWPHF